ncbi:MAG: cysteine desulfurase [Candidatus Aenigmarchaeota archaeon]|nr:cysteine desulfurase [Candidatus Aenigmarchaeota archaeon]
MTLRPVQVIDKIREYYEQYSACGERSIHKLGKGVDEEAEKAKKILRKFLNAKREEEIIFTKNTTEGINLVANAMEWKKEDVIVSSDKEHNSNLLPWQLLIPKGIRHLIVKSNPDNTFNLEAFEEKMNRDVKLVSMVHTSNLDGVTFPAKEIIKISHDHGAKVLLDAAQSIPHLPIDVRKLDVDLMAFSGHKMVGPSGTGILYGKKDMLESMKPFMVGGGTVIDTHYQTAKFEELPQKYEAGLQNYAGLMGLGEAANYIMRIGKENIEKQEKILNSIITKGMEGMKFRIIGPQDPEKRGSVVSFVPEKISPHEVAMMADEMENICLRSGAHCVHSWFNEHNLEGTTRASLYFYNTKEEAEKLIETLGKINELIK